MSRFPTALTIILLSTLPILAETSDRDQGEIQKLYSKLKHLKNRSTGYKRIASLTVQLIKADATKIPKYIKIAAIKFHSATARNDILKLINRSKIVIKRSDLPKQEKDRIIRRLERTFPFPGVIYAEQGAAANP
jgi:hypothetical protein